MKSDNFTITTGAFEHLDSLIGAIKELRSEGHENLTVYSPVPHDEIDEALEGAESAVGHFAMSGGILGWIAGLALTVGTAKLLPLITGGKPIVSFIPFYVIGFEMTILLGGLFTLFSFFSLSRLSRARAAEPYNNRFAEDRFGLVVRCNKEEGPAVQEIIRSMGAEEVSVE